MKLNKLKKLVASALVLVGLIGAPLAVISPAFAAGINPQQQACVGTGGTWSSTNNTCTGNSGDDNLTKVIKTIVNTILFALGAVAVVMVIVGGIRFVLSAGNASSVTAAKNTILYAVIGLVVALLAYAIVNFVIKTF